MMALMWTEHCDIHPDYGTLLDFNTFKRGASASMRVITELILNHTSDQHPWFQKSRKGKGRFRYKGYYVWRTIQRIQGSTCHVSGRGTFQLDLDLSKANYWHRFYRLNPN